MMKNRLMGKVLVKQYAKIEKSEVGKTFLGEHGQKTPTLANQESTSTTRP